MVCMEWVVRWNVNEDYQRRGSILLVSVVMFPTHMKSNKHQNHVGEIRGTMGACDVAYGLP